MIDCSVQDRVRNTATLKNAFQDFVELFIKNPAQASAKFPEISSWMNSEFKGKYPKTQAEIQKASEAYGEWLKTATPLEKVKSGIKFDKPESWLQWFKGKLGDIFNKENFEKNFISKLAPLRRISPEAEKIAEIYSGAAEAAVHYTKGGRYEFSETGRRQFKTGKSLDEIVAPIADHYEDAAAYLVSRTRSEDLFKKDKRYHEVKNKKEHTKEDLKFLESQEKKGVYEDRTNSALYIQDKAAMLEAEKKFPHLKEFGKEFTEFMRDNLAFARDAGLISQKSYDSMVNSHEMYAPLYRVVEGSNRLGLGTTGGMEPSNATKLRTNVESAYDIVDPIQTAYNNSAMIVAMSERNAVMRKLAKDAKGTAAQSLFEEVKTPKKSKEELLDAIQKKNLPTEYFKDLPAEVLEALTENPILKDEPTVNVFEDGVKKSYRVDPVIYEAIKGISSPRQMGWFFNLAAMPASALRYGATITPAYTARAFVRDIPHALTTSQYGLTLPDVFRGTFSALKKDAWYDEFIRSGGSYSSASSLTRSAWSENIDNLRNAKNRGFIKKWVVDNKLGLKKLQEFNHALENAPRIAEFRKAIESGATRQEAAHAARNITLDFQKKGAVMEVVNALVPFSNAFVQGNVQFLKYLKPKYGANGEVTFDDTVKPYLRGLAYMGAPAILNAVMNADNERIQNQPEWLKQTFYLVDTAPFYNTEKEKANAPIIRIPKTQEFGSIFGNAIEAAVQFIHDKDPKHFKEYAEQVYKDLLPSRLAVPTAAVPLIESFANKAIFYNSPIVPRDREGLLPSEQYNERTSEVFKFLSNGLGKIFGDANTFSPAVAENYVDRWTGSLGRDLLQGIDKGYKYLAGIDENLLEVPDLKDAYFLKSFVTSYPNMSVKPIRDFFENYKTADQVNNTVRKLAKEGKPKEAADLYKRYNKTKNQPAYKAMTRMLQFVKKIKQSDLPSEQKKELINQTTLQMIQVADQANKTMDL